MAPKHDGFKDFVLDQLSELPSLTHRAMFGGYGLYCGRVFFGIVHKGRLYFKTNETTARRYRERKMKPYRPNATQTLHSYYEVPVDILEDAGELAMGSAGQQPLITFPWHRLNRVPFGRLLLVGLLSCVCSFPAWAEEPQAVKSLWQTALTPPAADQPPMPRRPWVLRDREITLDLPLFQILKDAGARPHPRISVELFDGTNHELDLTSTVSRSNDTAVIRGTFKLPSRGDFTFVASGNLLVGTMQVGDRLYKTEHIANGRLRLLEVDPEKLPPE